MELWDTCNRALSSVLSGVPSTLGSLGLTVDAKGIQLPNGLYVQYPLLRRQSGGYVYAGNNITQDDFDAYMQGEKKSLKWTKIYGGAVTENVVQALAALVIREQMAAVGRKYRVLFQVHDEIVIAAPKEKANEAALFLSDTMSTASAWAPNLPVACEVGVGENYAEAGVKHKPEFYRQTQAAV